MDITPEQARAELERRRAAQITPEQAKAELERRRNPGMAGKVARGIDRVADFDMASAIGGPRSLQEAKDASIAKHGRTLRGALDFLPKAAVRLGEGIGDSILRTGADLTRDPVKTSIIEPAIAIRDLPSNVGSTAGSALERDWDSAKSSGLKSLEGALSAAGVVPLARGAGRGIRELGSGARAVTSQAPRLAADEASEGASTFATLERLARAEDVDLPKALADMPGDPNRMLFQELNMGQAAQGLGNRAGPSRDIMTNASRAYMEGQTGRVTDAIGDALGNPDFDGTVNKLVEAQKAASGPFYDKAMQTPVSPQAMSNIMRVPALGDAFTSANKQLVREGREGATDMEVLHRAQGRISDDIGTAKRNARNNSASNLIDLRNRLLAEMDAVSGDYATGRSLYAGGAANADAIAAGQNVFKTKPREWNDAVKGMGDGERQAALAGVMDAVTDKLNRPASYATLPKDFRVPDFEPKVAALVGADKAKMLVRQLEQEADMMALAARARGDLGSKTTPSSQAIAQTETAGLPMGQRALSTALQRFKGFNPAAYADEATDAVTGVLGTVDEDIMTDVARILSMPADKGREALRAMSPRQLDAVASQLPALARTDPSRAYELGRAVARARSEVSQGAREGAGMYALGLTAGTAN